jgi:hypothetical protein
MKKIKWIWKNMKRFKLIYDIEVIDRPNDRVILEEKE